MIHGLYREPWTAAAAGTGCYVQSADACSPAPASADPIQAAETSKAAAAPLDATAGTAASSECAGARTAGSRRQYYVKDTRSYYEQFAALKGSTNLAVLHTPHPKPSMAANTTAPTAARSVPFSEVVTVGVQRPLLACGPAGMRPERVQSLLNFSFFWRAVGHGIIHALALGGCWFTFSWSNLAMALAIWAVCTCFGSSMAYHRLLSHRTFKTHWVVEYVLALIGVHSLQGPPIEWASNHRWHHKHTDTPLDLHSPYEGWWHAHMGWMFRHAEVERAIVDKSNVPELTSQWFYLWLEQTWLMHALARLYLTSYLMGFAGAVWAFAVPACLGFHVIFCVNSLGHLVGPQPYDTGDLSRDNTWLAAITFGEGFHNSHHAFAHSARYGMEWWQLPFDLCYCCLRAMEALGVVWDVREPSERERARKRKSDNTLTMW